MERTGRADALEAEMNSASAVRYVPCPNCAGVVDESKCATCGGVNRVPAKPDASDGRGSSYE
jgi:DnaJ-class molecular chaperone